MRPLLVIVCLSLLQWRTLQCEAHAQVEDVRLDQDHGHVIINPTEAMNVNDSLIIQKGKNKLKLKLIPKPLNN